MENHGIIIQHLRLLAGLSVRQASKKIQRSLGWLSEIENNNGRSRLTENEFGAGDGTQTRDLCLCKASLYQLSYSRI